MGQMTPERTAQSPRGMSQLRPGFGWTRDDDVAFALGFPHLRRVVDNTPADDEPWVAAQYYLDNPGLAPQLSFPTRVSYGLVRVWGMPAIWETTANGLLLRGDSAESLWIDAPVDARKAAQLVACRMERDTHGLNGTVIENFVFLLEAQVGTEPVARAVVDTLEGMDADALLSPGTIPAWLTYQLGYLMLRLPEAVAAELQRRLERVLDLVHEGAPGLRKREFVGVPSCHARSVHLILNGARAAEETDHQLRWYGHVTHPPRLVHMRVSLCKTPFLPDSRLVFLGGPGTLERVDEERRRLATVEEQRWFLHTHGPIRGSAMLTSVLDLTLDSLIREEAIAWLAQRADQFDGALEAMATGQGVRARASRAVLERR